MIRFIIYIQLLLIPLTLPADFQGHAAKLFNDYCTKCHDEDLDKGGVRLDNIDWKDLSLLKKIEQVVEQEDMPPAKAKKKLPQTKRQEFLSAIRNYRKIKDISYPNRFISSTELKRYLDKYFDISSYSKTLPTSVDFSFTGKDEFGFEVADLTIIDRFSLASYYETISTLVDYAIPTSSIPVKQNYKFLTPNEIDITTGANFRHTHFKQNTFILTMPSQKAMTFIFKSPETAYYKVNFTAKYEKVNDSDKVKGLRIMRADSQVRHTHLDDTSLLPLYEYLPLTDEFKNYSVEIIIPKDKTIRFEPNLFIPDNPNTSYHRLKFGHSHLHFKNIEIVGPVKFHKPLYNLLVSKGKSAENIADQISTIFLKGTKTNYDFCLNLLKRFSGDGHRGSINKTLKAVLTSPYFMLIDDYRANNINSRLSYLIKGMNGTVPQTVKHKEDIFKYFDKAVENDSSGFFFDNFASQWLDYSVIDNTLLEQSIASQALKLEVREFLRYIYQKNLPIDYFVKSDFSFREKRFYDMMHDPFAKLPFTPTLNKVKDPNGGILTSKAALYASNMANEETSPILRGVFVLKKFLGMLPPPPPAEVPDFDDIKLSKKELSKLSLREKIKLHSNASNSCGNCHIKFDPLGISLDMFDWMGNNKSNGKLVVKNRKYRIINGQDKFSEYSRSLKEIDSGKKGKLKSSKNLRRRNKIIDYSSVYKGETIKDINELKQVLLTTYKKQYYTSFSRRLFTYILHRKLKPAEEEFINSIVRKNMSSGLKFKDLCKELISSNFFIKGRE